eukprot:1300861-Amphidinium_carterae.1
MEEACARTNVGPLTSAQQSLRSSLDGVCFVKPELVRTRTACAFAGGACKDLASHNAACNP